MSFTEFWASCPRKVGRPQAQAAYMVITTTGKWVHNRQSGDKWFVQATEEECDEGMKRFARQASWGNDLTFCPHPTTWLHAGRMFDEPEEIDPVQFMGHDERREHSHKVIEEAKAADRYGNKLRIVSNE